MPGHRMQAVSPPFCTAHSSISKKKQFTAMTSMSFSYYKTFAISWLLSNSNSGRIEEIREELMGKRALHVVCIILLSRSNNV